MENKKKFRNLRKKTTKKTELIKTKAQEYVRGEDTAEDNPPRVTNENVAKHREEILSGARRFVYPLQHSKYKIAIISGLIVLLVSSVLFGYSWFLLYRQQSTSDLVYRITQIIPFHVAKVDDTYVRYEEYLFELRQNVHYLVNQENVDFNSEQGLQQLEGLKAQALERVIGNTIIRSLAKENGIEITKTDVDEQIALIRTQGGVGDSVETLEDTLADFYGWTVQDLERVVSLQILKQRLIPILDTETLIDAERVLSQIKGGADFKVMAETFSEDPFTNGNGGAFGYVFRSNTEIPIPITEKGFELAEGEVSDIVETTYGLHIVQNQGYRNDDEAKIAHILFTFADIEEFVKQRKDNTSITKYIDIDESLLELNTGNLLDTNQ